MASTVTRFTWTDDSGSAANPNGDGTIINNAQLQLIFDAVDGLFTGELVAGRLSAESHSSGIAFKADVANSGGGVIARVRNTQAGTSAFSEVRIGNDGSEQSSRIIMCSTTYTAGGRVDQQDGLGILCSRAGGVNLEATHASGLVRQWGKSGFNVTRANITANQTDYAPTAAGTYILTPDANRNISGFAGGVDGRRIRIINGAAIGSGFVLTLVIGAGSAGNQVTDHTAGNIALNPQAGVDLDYDGTNTVWVGGPR